MLASRFSLFANDLLTKENTLEIDHLKKGETLVYKPLHLRFSIEYRQFEGPEEHIPARRAVERVLKQSGLSTAFSFVKVILL